MTLSQLRRIRWAVRIVLVAGFAASAGANILHAEPNAIARTISAWPPIAMLLTVEIIARIPVHLRWLAVVRILAASAVAGVAAWVSYWHMASVASAYGETGSTPYLLPISVDGLIIVASVSLVELAGRIRVCETRTASSDLEPEIAHAGAQSVQAMDDFGSQIQPASVESEPTVDPVSVAAVTSGHLPAAPVSPAPAGARTARRTGVFGLPPAVR